MQATALAAGLDFPHAAQAIRLTRRIRSLAGQGKRRTVTVYAITSLSAHQATPGQLAWIRGHWQIEVLHHIRDVSYREDFSQIRTGNGPQVMATLRNVAMGILKLAGHAQHRSRLPPPRPLRHQNPGHPRHQPAMTETGHYATMPEPCLLG